MALACIPPAKTTDRGGTKLSQGSMGLYFVKCLFWAMMMLLVLIDETKGCLEEERKGLLAFKTFLIQSKGKDVNYTLPSWVWDTESECCNWESVTCDSSTGHVTELYLNETMRTYSTASFGFLNLTLFQPFKNLKILDLSSNDLDGWNQNQDFTYLSELTKLETIDLGDNHLDKEILRSLGALPALTTLYFQYNNMQGHLSDKELAGLRNLEVLMLGGCDLNGTLPEGLCDLKNLRMLDLSGNELSGSLPPCIGNLTSLRALDVASNQLSGNISSSVFARLTSLEYLSLSDNYFRGLFQLSTLANHSKLEILSLAMLGNGFQVETERPSWFPSFQLKVLIMPNCSINTSKKTIPSFLFYQHDLIYIDLSYNDLVGAFPSWLLHNNSLLEVMALNDNSFTGSFELPTDPNKRMHHLRTLSLSNNKIGGQLPEDIGHFLPNLESLYMSSNAFHGSIPSSFGGISLLTILDLANNNFSGQVPRLLSSNCTFLEVLRLSNNSLHGQLFPSYWNLGILRVLFLDNNYFSGTMQDGLRNSVHLRGLDISNNQFSGALPRWLSSVPILSVLSMSGNNFEGEIPHELCKLDLEFINLSHNRLSGYLPSCLNRPSGLSRPSGLNRPPLRFIHLQGNRLVGSIPESFSGMSNLVTLDLRDNQLSGNIPNWIFKFRHLKVLLLAVNQFRGHLPVQLCLLQELSFLDLSHNNFTGSIPLCFSNVSFGKEEVNLRSGGETYEIIPFTLGLPALPPPIYDYAQFNLKFSRQLYYISTASGGHEMVEFTTKSRSLSYEGSILDYMSGVDLSCNQLSGEIPEQIGDLVGIHALNLSRNYFSGSIPASLSKLVNVESLDLSYNNLSGKIPSQLDELHSLAIFNVSYNHLSGLTPSKGQFATFDESSYIGNPELRWTLGNDKNSGTEPTTPSSVKYDDDDAIEMVTFYWSFCASYVMVLVALITVFYINPYWKALWFHFIDRCVIRVLNWLLKVAFY